MRFIRIFQVVAMILLICTVGVKAARAAEQKSDLMLDGGFVGRSVSLELFDDSVKVGWEAGALVKPTNMSVSQVSEGILKVIVSEEDAFASGAVLHIALVSSVVNAPAFQVVQKDGSVISYRAAKNGMLIQADIPVQPVMDISVVSNPDAISASNDDMSSSMPLSSTDEKAALTLDAGFLNHPVSLDLFGGEVTVAWDAKALTKPTTLTVTSMRGGTWSDQEEAADGVSLAFGDADAVSSSGMLSITHRALRPPTSTEHPSVNIFEKTGTSTRQAVFSGTTVKYTHEASADISFAPVFCSGIMRTGTATWYRYKGCLCAASPDVPKGTKLKVARQDDPTKSVVVTVNDYGPDRARFPERVIDLDRVAFATIGNPRGGTLNVTVDKVE